MAVVPDIGMLASFDPVALDQACADLCNAMPINPGSVLDDNFHDGHSADDVAKYPGHNHEHGACENHIDHFDLTHPDAEWETCLAHAEKIGLGSRSYELKRI